MRPVRYLSERQYLLARRPRRGLALQTRRLSGAQEVVVVPGSGGSWVGVVTGGGVVFCGGGAAHRGGISGDRYVTRVGLAKRSPLSPPPLLTRKELC